MEPKAERIVDIISDYENNQMTVEHVIDWVSQFDSEDQEFILDELALIFEKTYLSREACKRNILGFLEQLAIKNKYADVPSFLVDTVFLDLQEDHKSQKELLNLLTEVLEDKFSLSFADCGGV